MSKIRLFCILNLFLPKFAYAACSISTPNLIFSNYDPSIATPTTAFGVLTITCTNDGRVDYTVDASTGNGTYAQRYMLNGLIQLNYNLYTNSTYTSVWGNGGSGTSQFIGVNKKCKTTPCQETYYGRIPALQVVGIGTYQDPITITLYY